MSEERERQLLKEGEALAHRAAECGVGNTQLKELFKVFQAHPVAYFEAYVKTQAGRKPPVRGFDCFTDPLLEVLRKHDDSREEIQSILGYLNRTFGWVQMSMGQGGVAAAGGYRRPRAGGLEVGGRTGQSPMAPGGASLGPDVAAKIQRLIGSRLAELGLEGEEARKDGSMARVTLRVDRFPKDVRSLADEVGRLLKSLDEFKGSAVRVWFETPRR